MSQFNTFFISHHHGEESQVMMNAFLRAHRILAVEKSAFPDGWAFCVEWMEGTPGAAAPGGDIAYRRGERIDYMKVLSPEVFARFSALRAKRKELSVEKGVRAYEILTDAQMAEVAKLEEPTIAAIGRIPGIGESRLKQFGKIFVEVLESISNDAIEAASESRTIRERDALVASQTDVSADSDATRASRPQGNEDPTT